jgi:hypothetical protein
MSLETLDNAGVNLTQEPSLTGDDNNEENKALAFRVYKEVWDEFNKWKVEDCKQQLLLLQKPLPPREITETTLRISSALRPAEPSEVEILYLCDTKDDVPLDAGAATVLTCKAIPLEPPNDFAPHPRYESCTPASQTIALRMGSAAHDELDVAPFVPYADDAAFNAREYLSQFRRFAWEELVDPDGGLRALIAHS